jgi:hypothetical protein
LAGSTSPTPAPLKRPPAKPPGSPIPRPRKQPANQEQTEPFTTPFGRRPSLHAEEGPSAHDDGRQRSETAILQTRGVVTRTPQPRHDGERRDSRNDRQAAAHPAAAPSCCVRPAGSHGRMKSRDLPGNSRSLPVSPTEKRTRAGSFARPSVTMRSAVTVPADPERDFRRGDCQRRERPSQQAESGDCPRRTTSPLGGPHRHRNCRGEDEAGSVT